MDILTLKKAQKYTDKKEQEIKLKIAQIEKELGDYQQTMAMVNINQEPTQQMAGAGVVSLPKNAADGQFVSTIFRGLTEETKSTIGACRLRSVGKNLFDKNNVSVGMILSTGMFDPSLSEIRTSDYIEVASNTTYTLKNAAINSSHGLDYFDVDKNHLDEGDKATGYNETRTFTTGSNTKYIRASVHIDNLDSAQIEEGTVATPYEPYKESTQYLPNVGELRSLPNGTKDEVRVSGGKADLIKRVSNEINTWDLVWGNASSPGSTTENYWSVTTGSLSGLVSRTATVRWNLKNYNGISYASFADYNIADKLTSIISPTFDTLYLKIPKAEMEIVSSSNIMAWLEQNQVTLTYQLAEPIVTDNVQVSGTLLSNPSGTIYVENAVADAGLYTDKITILQQDLPIRELEKIAKVDFITGAETELDISQAVISTDKLSFIHPDLADGDIVFFTYFYDRESTLGEVTLEYYDSRYILKDSVTNKFYKVVPAVANGILTNTLVEV